MTPIWRKREIGGGPRPCAIALRTTPGQARGRAEALAKAELLKDEGGFT
jgi:hypothetical protein